MSQGPAHGSLSAQPTDPLPSADVLMVSTMTEKANVVVIGAGIAGASTTYDLAVTHRIDRVVVCDPRAPLTLTSDKSTECFRNWWPRPDDAMVRLMNRSSLSSRP